MDKHVMIYFRKNDGIYVIPEGVSEAGWIHIEPFYYLPLDARPEDVWSSIEKAFESANRKVLDPKAWGGETAWYRKAGVKTWRDFAGKTKTILGLTQTGDQYVFKVSYYDRGRVYSDKETTVKVSKGTGSDVIVASLKKFL